jgi:hypothetical protein
MSARTGEKVPAAVRSLARPELVLVPLVFAGLAYRLWRAWEEIPAIVLKITADDAYYYFQIANNVADGRNVTFDGETVTNGFHPLWLAILTPVYFITDDVNVAVHLGLSMAALLGAATVVLVYLIGRELTDNGWASLVGAAFFALHPYIVVESVNGMETAVAVFTMALTIWLFLHLVRLDSPTTMDYALVGIAGGLMVLGRTDSIFVLAAIGLFMLVREARRRAWQGPALIAGISLLVVAPWLIWNLVSLGTVVQISGIAVPEYNREVFLFWNGDSLSTQLERSWDVTKDALFDDLVHLYFVFPFTEGRLPFLFASAGLLVFMLVAPFAPQRQHATRHLALLAVPAIGVLAMLLFHSAVRWHLREWYYGPVTIIASALITIGVEYAHSLLGGTKISWRQASHAPELRFTGDYRWVPYVALYGIAAAIIFTVYGPSQSERWVDRRALPHRSNMLEGAYWLRDNTPEDARVSAFNAGIFGYFSERDVINLDGVVNENAHNERIECRTSEYMAAMRAEYVVDVEMTQGFPTIDSLGVLPCGDEPCLEFEELVEVGRTLAYFGGGQVDVLRLNYGEGCA